MSHSKSSFRFSRPRGNGLTSILIKTIFLKFRKGVVPSVFGERVRQANHLGILLTNDIPHLDVPNIDQFGVTQSAEIGEKEKSFVDKDYHDVIQSFGIPKFS